MYVCTDIYIYTYIYIVLTISCLGLMDDDHRHPVWIARRCCTVLSEGLIDFDGCHDMFSALLHDIFPGAAPFGTETSSCVIVILLIVSLCLILFVLVLLLSLLVLLVSLVVSLLLSVD